MRHKDDPVRGFMLGSVKGRVWLPELHHVLPAGWVLEYVDRVFEEEHLEFAMPLFD